MHGDPMSILALCIPYNIAIHHNSYHHGPKGMFQSVNVQAHINCIGLYCMILLLYIAIVLYIF